MNLEFVFELGNLNVKFENWNVNIENVQLKIEIQKWKLNNENKRNIFFDNWWNEFENRKVKKIFVIINSEIENG